MPPTCNQKPGFSLVWPSRRPAAIARAAPTWSDASAESKVCQSNLAISPEGDKRPTENNVVLCCLLFDQIVVVELPNDKVDAGISAGNLLRLLFISYKSCVFVVRMLFVKSDKSVAGYIARDTGAIACRVSISAEV